MYALDGLCYYPIHEVVNYKKHEDAYEIIKMLADCGANLSERDYEDQMGALEMAAAKGHLEVFKFLEEKGVKESDEKLLEEMFRADKMDIESTKLLQYLIDRNPDYLANNESKLFELSEKGKFSLLEAFIKIGANVHAKNAEGQSLLDVLGKDVRSYMVDEKKWPKQLEKMKSVLEKAMKKKNKI